ncbi:MAG: hypothetical protein GY711_14425 [bacterium]|nr:hypothetical protein [bacterium]
MKHFESMRALAKRAAVVCLYALPVLALDRIAMAQFSGDAVILDPGTGETADFFGLTSSLSGDRLAVGAMRASNPEGRVYLFERSGDTWISIGAVAGDADSNQLFGSGVELFGDTLIVADNEPYNGKARFHAFESVGGEWAPTQVFMTSGEAGESARLLTLAADFAIIGAPKADHPQANEAGAVYFFERVGGVWTETRKLFADRPRDGAQFGGAAALSGNHLVIGEQTHEYKDNAVYFFERGPNGWAETERVLASDGSPCDLFGKELAIEGTLAIVAAPEKNGAWHREGAVYVFERRASGWVETGSLTETFANRGAFANRFGGTVALSGRSLVVGAAGATPAPRVGGQVFLYTREADGSWTREWSVDGEEFAYLGLSVEMNERWMMAAAPDAISQSPNGSRAYVWRREGGAVATSYCHPDPASTGGVVGLRAVGSETVAQNELTFLVDGLPQGSFAFLLASRGAADRPFHARQAMLLCLADPLERASGVFGGPAFQHTVSVPFDLTSSPNGIVVLPGERWRFQVWYRDGGTTNTSVAVSIDFR